MERSLVQLKSDFADMADKHKQINSFFWGNFVDAINQDAVDYPLMCCTLQPSQIGDSYTGVDLQVIICDKYNEQDYRMIDEVHSDMLRILKDIDVTLKQFRFQDYLDVETDFSTEPFINEGQDITAGWGGLMRMRVHDYENRCAIPYDGFDFDGSTTGTGCPSGTVKIFQSNGTTLIKPVDVPSGDTVNTNIADSVITLNTNEVTTNVKATDSKNYNLTDRNNNPVGVDSVSGDNVTLNTWWNRNPNWLDLPNINVGDERFVGLYAIFENDVDNNTITIDVGAGQNIDYGDGTVITSVAGTNTHNYNYATVSSPILQTKQGYNYKMVVVDVDLTGVTDMLLEQGLTNRIRRITGWLDIIASCSTLDNILLTLSGRAYPAFIERFILKDSANISIKPMQLEMLSNLKVYENTLLNITSGSINSFLSYASNAGVRDSQGQPISINNPNITDARDSFTNSGVDVLGDISLPNALFNRAFLNSSIREVGYITVTSATGLDQLFAFTGVYKVGTITVSTSLTTIFRSFLGTNIEQVIFAGDMSGVTNTSQAFLGVNNIKRLILPNITVGFDISDTQITGQNLQDLFNSLGTAAGAQTITLPNFTNGEPTAIATGKGYTIAYA